MALMISHDKYKLGKMHSFQDTLCIRYLLDAVQPFLRYRGCQAKTVEVTSKSIHS